MYLLRDEKFSYNELRITGYADDVVPLIAFSGEFAFGEADITRLRNNLRSLIASLSEEVKSSGAIN